MAHFCSALLSPLVSSAAMQELLSDRARIQRMLDFEVALARAQAAVGTIPAVALDPIAQAARAERFDVAALAHEAAAFGDIAEPLVRALTAEVSKADATAGLYVHSGASSQDLVDTGLVLDLKAALDRLIAELGSAIDGFMKLTGRHRRTAAVSRPWLQHSLPLPLGLKLASYAAALARSRERLRRLRQEALVLQFGGAVGTLDALGDQGPDVAERLAALLDLPLPEAPWHSHRDRLAEVAGALAILAGTCGKIARDVSLLMQTEVGEALAPAASSSDAALRSSDPRNLKAAGSALAAAGIAPNMAATVLAAQVQEHERGLGSCYAEWLTLPALALVTSGALAAIGEIANGLEFDSERMRSNLSQTRGLNLGEAVEFALARKMGKQEAHRVVEEASRRAATSKRDLQDVLHEDERVTLHLSVGELAKLFEPLAYQGAAQVFIDRIAASLHGRSGKR
jgi:3-carboxy-cis,cis-muconate cycloisomerase